MLHGVRVIGIATDMFNMLQWISDNNEQLSRGASIYMLAYYTTMLTYAQKTLHILQRPDVVAPIMGRRCIFY